MKRTRCLAALAAMAMTCATAFAQSEGTPVRSVTGNGPPGGSVAHTVGTEYIDTSVTPNGLWTCTSVTIAAGPAPPAGTITCNWTQAGSGGVSSPTSLTSYFNGYTGLSPKDCSTSSCNTPGVGAFGDWHSFFDCTITGGTAIENCTGSHFTSTAVDGGKAAELECNNAITVTTILSVQSATQATLATTCSVTQTNTAFAFGHDDTAALRNWAAFISASFSPTSGTATARAGYLPRGIYYSTQPVRFVWPTAAQPASLDKTSGECGKISGGTIWCGVFLMGDGPWSSVIVGSSNFNWSVDGTSTNTALCYFKNWSGSYITNMGCGWAMGQESGFATNTTAQTGMVGTWGFDGMSHTKWDSNFAYAGHNTNSTFPGIAIAYDFESEYSNSAVEFNDINLWINPLAASLLYEKIVFDTLFCEGAGGGNNGSIQINTNSALKQVTFRNVHTRDGTVPVNIRTSVTTTNGDALVFDRFRWTTANTGALGFVVQSAIKLEFNNPYFEDTSATAGNTLFDITSAAGAATINFFGGGFQGTGLTNAIQSADATPASIYIYGTNFASWTPSTLCNANCSQLSAFLPTATGWNGPGIIQSTQYVANQGTALSNGSLGTLTGWGTGASAAVCATPQPGFAQTGCFTITSGSASFAAAPSVTVTLPNALPSSATPCTLDVIDITGAGGAIMWKQTTNSATAPVFTAKTNTGAAFTPAVTETYTMILRCGP